MKNNKTFLLFFIIIILIILGGYYCIKHLNNNKNETQIGSEYTPQEEINEQQLRQTIVSLYFINPETGKITPEARMIDVADLAHEPYKKLIDLLIEGPKSEKLKKLIPDNVKVNKAEINGDCVTLDLSEEFLNYGDDVTKNNIINSIVNTLTELTEVNSVKILINGQMNDSINDVYVRL